MNCAAPPPRTPYSGSRYIVMVRGLLPLSSKSKSKALMGYWKPGTYICKPKAVHIQVDGFWTAKYSRSEELFVFRSFGLTCQFGSSHSRIEICFP